MRVAQQFLAALARYWTASGALKDHLDQHAGNPRRTDGERGIPAPGRAAGVLAATLGLAAACWAVAAWLMDGMDMGVATRPGPFGFFAAASVTMMAATMLPGAAPAIARHVRLQR